MSVRKGELVGILGRVGAGKVRRSVEINRICTDLLQSSLLAAIIGGMVRRDGEVNVYGSVAYAPQNPW